MLRFSVLIADEKVKKNYNLHFDTQMILRSYCILYNLLYIGFFVLFFLETFNTRPPPKYPRPPFRHLGVPMYNLNFKRTSVHKLITIQIQAYLP